jgi:hypothetical protein
MTQNPLDLPQNYYSPLTGTEDTSSETSTNNMEQDTGQPPTKSTQPKGKSKTTTPRNMKTMKKNEQPTRSSQRATAQGFLSYPGLHIQERRMLRHAIPHLIDNRTHPARHLFIGTSGPIIKEKIEQDTEMPLDKLRRHILKVANRWHVTKTEGTPPIVKYTTTFLTEFNNPEIIESDMEDKLSQSTAQANPTDDETTSVIEQSPNLLESPIETTMETTQLNLVSPPLEKNKATPAASSNKPKRLTIKTKKMMKTK